MARHDEIDKGPCLPQAESSVARLQPFGEVIETERLLLRPMQAADVDDLLLIFADPKVMAAFEEPVFDRAQMERWIRRNLEHQAQYGYGLFSVILKASGLLAGDCGLEQMTVGERPEIELGYDFQSRYWNRGLATEAATAVLDYAFWTLQLPRIISLIRPANKASQRVAEKIGMRLTTTVVRHAQQYLLYTAARAEGGIPAGESHA